MGDISCFFLINTNLKHKKSQFLIFDREKLRSRMDRILFNPSHITLAKIIAYKNKTALITFSFFVT